MAVVLAATLLGLVAGEVLVRIFKPQVSLHAGQGLYVVDEHCGHRLRPNLRQRVPDHGELVINSQGLRDIERPLQKPAGIKRVLVLGDSFTFASVPLEQSFCRVLSASLGESVDVINTGVGGWSTYQQAAYLEHYGLAYDPDVIVVATFVGNDLWENCGLNDFRVVDNELVPAKKESRSLRRRIMGRSHLYRLVRRVPESIYHRLRGDSIEARRYHKIERRRMGVCVRDPEAQKSWEPGWEVARKELTRIRDLAAGRPVVLFLIPDEFQADPALLDAVCARYELDKADYDLERPQARLAALGRELGLTVVDALGPCRERIAKGEPLYIPNDSHWNVAGNALAAELLAAAPPIAELR